MAIPIHPRIGSVQLLGKLPRQVSQKLNRRIAEFAPLQAFVAVGAALKNCFDFVVFSHGNHSLSVVALVFCLHILLYKNRDFGTRKSKLFLIF